MTERYLRAIASYEDEREIEARIRKFAEQLSEVVGKGCHNCRFHHRIQNPVTKTYSVHCNKLARGCYKLNKLCEILSQIIESEDAPSLPKQSQTP